ncbi:MAG: tRNA (guanine(10)-N(2))-dimethyltransferase [Candidatus Micrarchaeota archaeon]|nr:tRNA (guanine(10)-N(2))-dimethyltransferase [Candidatus Micrarchaeota archaeon]
MPKNFIEGKAKLKISDGVFYNPEMELCRDMFSLCIGALPAKLSVIDAMCASGARGIRYKLENRNVSAITLCDQSKKAAECARKNVKLNKMRCKVICAPTQLALRKGDYDLVELDPFGSPQPFLHDVASSLEAKKEAYFSVTATDMAVLCGAHSAACLKNYFSIPLDNEFCHENACRILVSSVIREFSPLGIAAYPIFAFSHRHYIKIILRLKKNAEEAVFQVKKTGFVSYCHACCYRKAARIPVAAECLHCKEKMVHAGPLYIGELWDTSLAERMLALNAERKYRNARKLEKLLMTVAAESKIRAYGYYDLHILAKKAVSRIFSMEDAIARIRKAGFAAERTHFCPTAIRTDAPHEKVLEILS